MTAAPRRTIFVFGSNLAGRHGAGAAKYARSHHGAIYGQGEGPQGDSYAIPTKDGRNRAIPLAHPSQRLPLQQIRVAVERFLVFARTHEECDFKITAIGCGLATYEPRDIAPFFATAPANCRLPPEFWHALGRPPRPPSHNDGEINMELPGYQPDFAAPIIVERTDIHAANLYFTWQQRTVGFGECHISINEDGSLTASTEHMSREWLRRALHAAIDTLVDAAVLRD